MIKKIRLFFNAYKILDMVKMIAEEYMIDAQEDMAFYPDDNHGYHFSKGLYEGARGIYDFIERQESRYD